MAGEARSRMAESAMHLLAQRGLQATTFAEVLERSGAARGSVYHHFPGGKDELVDAALDLADSRLRQVLDQLAGSSPIAITEEFLRLWRGAPPSSPFPAGGAGGRGAA